MQKIRITFVDDGSNGIDELNNFIRYVREGYNIIEQSKIYKEINNSEFSKVYLTIEPKK